MHEARTVDDLNVTALSHESFRDASRRVGESRLYPEAANLLADYAATGDLRRLAEAASLCSNHLVQRILPLAGDVNTAEDAVQDVWLTLVKARSSATAAGLAHGLQSLELAAARKVMQYSKRERRTAAMSGLSAADRHELGSIADKEEQDPLRRILIREMASQVAHRLETFYSKYRHTLAEAIEDEGEGRLTDGIEPESGQPTASTARVRLHRARKAFAKRLAGVFDDRMLARKSTTANQSGES